MTKDSEKDEIRTMEERPEDRGQLPPPIPIITDNEFGLAILDTLQKNMSIHVSMDLVGRFLLGYMFTKHPELQQKDKYEICDLAEPTGSDGEQVDSSDYTIGIIPIAGHIIGRQYSVSILSQAGSLQFKALIADILEAVEVCLKRKPVVGSLKLLLNITDKGLLSVILVYTYKEAE